MKITTQKTWLIESKRTGILLVCLLGFMMASAKTVNNTGAGLEANENTWLTIPASNSKIAATTKTATLPSEQNTIKEKHRKLLHERLAKNKEETASCVPATGVIYVDASIAASGSGNCWETAFKTLREAVLHSHSNTAVTTIHIARGTYYTAGAQNSTNRNISFLLPLRSNIALYGGYPSGGGTRDIKANPTILSGDIGNPNDASDNSYHVLVITNIQTSSAGSIIVDGLTITAGNANGSGADATFSYNGLVGPQNEGGGILLRSNGGVGDNIIIRNTTITKNSASNNAGGIYMWNSSALVQKCIISENTAPNGGGVFINQTANPRIVNSVISKNTAVNGGGIYSSNTSTSLKITNSTIADNIASGSGNSLHNNGQATVTVANSILWSNNAAKNIYHVTTPLNINYSNVLVASGIQAGMGNINQAPLFRNAATGNYKLLSCSPGINAGNNAPINSAPPGSATLDVSGNLRIFGTNVDMGAYELQSTVGNQNLALTAPPSQTACINSIFPATPLGENGQLCLIIDENATQTITAPPGALFNEVIFASYGNATGTCSTGFTLGSCHLSSTKSIIENMALGERTFTVTPSIVMFEDPCSSTAKKLYLTLGYTYPESSYSWTNSNPAIGLPASGTGTIPSFTASQSGTATITITAGLDACTAFVPTTFIYTVQNPYPVYVDGNEAVSGNGKSWSTAFKTLKEALESATVCASVKEIHVAKGTYYPTGTQDGTDRNATFLIPRRGGIEIYGGYPNGGGTRNIKAYPTILSGEIGDPTSISDNSYHVMIGNNASPGAETVIIDGLTITGGNANGGQYTYNGQLVNQNEGGGLVLRSNHNLGANIIIRNTIITKNRSTSSGGGLYLAASSALVHNTVISENTSVGSGGGVFVYDTSNPRFVNSLIVKNTALNGAGILSVASVTSLKIVNCTLADNNASNNGHNLHNNGQATTTISNSIIWSNDAAKNIYHITAPLNSTYSNIQSTSGVYAGAGNINQDPIFINTSGGNYLPTVCSPVIEKGNNAAINSFPLDVGTLDIVGESRVMGTHIDMGAYEHQTAWQGTNIVIDTPPSKKECIGSVFSETIVKGSESGQVCFIVDSNTTQTITAPPGTLFTEVIFSSYGTSSGTCETGFTLGSCNAVTSETLIESLAVGKNSFTISPNTATFGDPCFGTYKKLYVILAYALPEYNYSWTNDNPAIGLPASGTGNIPSFTAVQEGTANITLTASLNLCTVSNPVTFTYTVEDNITVFVDGTIAASGNGRSWATAFKTVKEAFEKANQCAGIKTINIAKGTYYPTGAQNETNRDATFLIPQRARIELYGGYPNGGGVRNIKANPTILSGDIGALNVPTDNSHHVLTMVNTTGTEKVIIDGLTITGGNANGENQYEYNGHLVSRNEGGGLLFKNNSSLGDNIIIRNVTIAKNTAAKAAGFYMGQSSALLHHAIITENNASANGGGVFIEQGADPKVINTLIVNNTAIDGAGIYATNVSALNIINSTLTGNTASNAGDNLHNSSGAVTAIANSILWSADPVKNIHNEATLNASYSAMQQTNGIYPGTGNINQDPMFKNTGQGDYLPWACSPVVNAGSNLLLSSVPSGSSAEDVLGNIRVNDSNVDMGACELQTIAGITNFPITTPVSRNTCMGTAFSQQRMKEGQVCVVIDENSMQVITAPSGALFSEVIFASYGNASGNCDTGFALGSCNSAASKSAIENLALGKNSFSVTPGNALFGADPCHGIVKKLYLTLAYAFPEYSWTNDNPAIGLPASGTGTIPAFTPVQSGTANITLTATKDVCTISNPVTFTYTVNDAVVYVDANVATSGDGKSWPTAFKTLKEALESVNAYQCEVVKTIHVAKGTYYPTGTQNGTDRNAAFLIPQDGGIEIYGGYPNGGGTRDAAANPTVLSGDIGVLDVATDNSYHVLAMVNTLPGAKKVIIDGLAITGGNADGVEVFTYHGTSTSQSKGGGVLLSNNQAIGDKLTIRNCVIKKNTARLQGGGLYANQTAIQMFGTEVSKNAVAVADTFSGGGIIIEASSTASRIINTVISNNTSVSGVGGIAVKQSPLTIINSTLVNNASSNGDGFDNLLNSNSSIAMTNTIAWGADPAKNISNLAGGVLAITYSNIQQLGSTYTGEGNLNIDPIFKDKENADYSLQYCSPALNTGNNASINNVAASAGTLDKAGSPRLYGNKVDMGAYEFQAASGGTTFQIAAIPSKQVCKGSIAPEMILMGYYEGELCFIINENATQTITAPAGTVFTEVIFASYGNASGDCTTGFTLGTCNASNSKNIIESLALGKNSFAVVANNVTFGEPCSGTIKKLYLTLKYSYPFSLDQYTYSWTNDNPAIGLPASGTGNLPSFTAIEAGKANITLQASLNEDPGCTVSNKVIFQYIVSEPVVYVDASVPVSGDGNSWENAFKTLKEAFDAANQCTEIKTVNVAKGTYYPTGSQNGTDRNATFLIPQRGNFEIYGGFPNGGGVRDIEANPTILSGNIGNPNAPNDNSYHVMTMANMASGAPKVIVDGFTITEGYADGYYDYTYNGRPINQSRGGGFLSDANTNIEDRFMLRNCIIKKNFSYSAGSLYLSYTSAQMENVQVLENVGGGILIYYCSPTILNSVIKDNTADRGAGIYAMHNYSDLPTKIINCTIANNAASFGGGIYIQTGNIQAINSAIVNNTAINHGGGLYSETSYGNSTFTNVTISGNSASHGGAMSILNAIIRNSIIYGNNSGLYYYYVPQAISNSLIQGFPSTSNGNINGNTNPLFVNPANADYRLQDTSPVIDKGNSTHFATGQTPDLQGNKRWVGINVDMGAYENQSSLGSCPDDTVWNGTTWSNGAPDTNKKVYINGDLTLATNLEACELEVTTNGSLNIPSGKNFTINDRVVNKATAEDFTIASGGSLLQINSIQNTGAITVNRNSFPLYRQDYTLWGSPVAQHNLRNFSPLTLFNRFYSYDTNLGTEGDYAQEIFTNADVQDKRFEPAKGYMIRMPNDWPVYVNNTIAGTPYPGKFVGVPNNGDIAIPLSTGNTGMNLVANPYPSPLSISDLFADNPGIEQTIYFWRKRNGVEGSGYASYNAFGLTSSQPEIDGLDLQGVIAVGQGFFVQSAGATTLQFSNPIRQASPGGMMLRNGAERHRIWLNLSNSTDIISQTLLGYATRATAGPDNGLDGVYFNDSPISLTSLIDDTEYAIQARPVPFEITDEVPLGFKTNVAGSYTIALSNTDGLFAQGQDIYLKDNLSNQLHDLKASAYSFTANAGTFNGRFSVVYQSSTLGVENPDLDPNRIVVYTQEQAFHVNSGTLVMQQIELFDIRGRLIHTLKDIGNTKARIDGLNIANQVLLMKITSVENETVVKKVIY